MDQRESSSKIIENISVSCRMFLNGQKDLCFSLTSTKHESGQENLHNILFFGPWHNTIRTPKHTHTHMRKQHTNALYTSNLLVENSIHH